MGQVLVEAITPLSLEVALEVADELRARAEEVDRLRRQHVGRARYEAELAERRYRHDDPANRMLANTLEGDWNEKLRTLAEAQQAYEEERKADPGALDDKRRGQILALATDFPRLWRDPATPAREKKRMARLIIEDVTLIKDTTITVRFRGGATRTLTLPLPLSAADFRRTAADVVRRLDQLLEHHTEEEAAEILNTEGRRTGTKLPFNLNRVSHIRRYHGLKPRYDRLREKGLLTVKEMAAQLEVIPQTVKIWRAAGLLTAAYPYNSKNEGLYEPPAADRPRKHTHTGLSRKGIRTTHTPTRSLGAV